MDPRLERSVKVVDAVGGEEHYSAVILELLQEDSKRATSQLPATILDLAVSGAEEENSLEMRRLRRMSAVVRASRKMSHSSRRRIAFHLLASSRTSSRDSSISMAVSPSSPALMEYSGCCISSATETV